MFDVIKKHTLPICSESLNFLCSVPHPDWCSSLKILTETPERRIFRSAEVSIPHRPLIEPTYLKLFLVPWVNRRMVTGMDPLNSCQTLFRGPKTHNKCVWFMRLTKNNYNRTI